MIDDEDLEWGFGRFRFQPKLLAQSLEKCWSRRGIRYVRAGSGRPVRLRRVFERKVESSTAPGLIHQWATHLPEAGRK